METLLEIRLVVLGPRRARVDVCETRRPPGTGVVDGDELLLIAPCTQLGAKSQQISMRRSNLARDSGPSFS